MSATLLQSHNIIDRLPQVRGRITHHAAIAPTTWFQVGGPAEVLFKPADREDLSNFLAACPLDIPITVLGVCSNLIIRDGGIAGVVIRLGRDFADIHFDSQSELLNVGAAALDMNVAQYAANCGRGGVEFLSGIPGTIGGALRMNAGAYGREIVDVIKECTLVKRTGEICTLKQKDMGMNYRHTNVASDVIFLSAALETISEESSIIAERIEAIRLKRTESQPVREKTGGSTFANPSPDELISVNIAADQGKAWQLIDAVGGRGLQIGGAIMSEKHCNFMINTGNATAADLENLGEEIRRRVIDKFGISLRWEIKRIGEYEVINDQNLITKGHA